MTTVAVIQARMGSTRLPGKVLMDLGGRPVLAWSVRACRAAAGVDEVVVATTTEARDDAIVEWCRENAVHFYRGSETDVLSRFVGTAEKFSADVILRLTADCPLLDPDVIGAVVRLRKNTGAAYCSNIHPRTYADGLDVECFTRGTLEIAHREATRAVDRDTVTYWMVRNRSRFPAEAVVNPIPGLQDERWVLDTTADMEFCHAIAKRWPWEKGPPSQLDILDILDREPSLRDINRHHVMNERFFDALADEAILDRSYGRSQAQLARAEAVIPLGAQTFSKSRVQFPAGSPLFLSHGQGGLVYDVDGSEYVDMVGGLLPIVLGYRDPDVDSAIRRQLCSGISFSLSTELEAELAERLRRLIPCAEMARFCKNGTDATQAAVRLARAYTGRDRILICGGYHGWADWSIAGTERDAGVPRAMRELVVRAVVGQNVTSILQREDIAAVIVEPETRPDYLRYLREDCDIFGSTLIFDEIITGFRWDLGGAQKWWGITPDLACFGKAMGNGMPINAVVGRREIMSRMAPGNQPNIFFSGTFQGETLSIAAAIATIDKLERDKVIPKLWSMGECLREEVQRRLDAHGMETTITLHGLAPLIRLTFRDDKIATLFRKEMIASGTLIIASHNLCAAHDANCIKRILKSYDHTLPIISDALRKGDIDARIGDSVVAPMVRAS